MKHKLQWLGKLFFLSTAALLWGSCQNDDGITRPVAESEITSRYISLKELKQKTADFENFKTAENKLKKQAKNKSAKMAYDSSLGFYIDTENILLIEKDGYHSYTFPILRDEGEGKIENLVISFNSGMEMQACISQYDLTVSEKELIAAGGTIENLDKKTTLSTLEGNKVFSDGYSGFIRRNPDGSCSRPGRITELDNGMISIRWVSVDCPGGDNGSTSNTGPGSSTGGGAGGSGPVAPPNPENPSNPGNGTPPRGPVTGNPGSNPGGNVGGDNGMYFPTDPVITKPILPQISHCAEMKKMNDTTAINVKPKIESLKQTLGQPGENGIVFKKTDNTYSYEDLPPSVEDNISIPTGITKIGAVHTHPLTTQPMFSWPDVYVLFNLYLRALPENKSEVTFMLVCRDDDGNDQVYALKVDDWIAFRNRINIEMSQNSLLDKTIDQKNKILDAKLGAKYREDSNYERVFLKFFKDFSISIYKGANANTDAWVKLTLENPEDTNSNVKKTPCN